MGARSFSKPARTRCTPPMVILAGISSSTTEVCVSFNFSIMELTFCRVNIRQAWILPSSARWVVITLVQSTAVIPLASTESFMLSEIQ